jgi:hypothetical protein
LVNAFMGLNHVVKIDKTQQADLLGIAVLKNSC